MKEIEILFYDIEKNDLYNRLQYVETQLVYAEFLQKRFVYDQSEGNNVYKWLRLRQESDKITLSYKETKKGEYANETEIIVDDIDKTKIILEKSGLKLTAYEETKREKYKYKNSEITIDTWPWLLPTVDIESPNEEELLEIVNELGLDMKKSFKGNINNVYKLKYCKTIQELPASDQLRIVLDGENVFL